MTPPRPETRFTPWWPWALVTALMAIVGVLLGPVFGRADLSDNGLGIANMLFMFGLAVFIAVLGVGLLTGEPGA